MATMRHERPHPLRVFGTEVRRYRELAELSQAQLGDKVPISSSHVGKIERGETRCDRKLSVRMDQILDARGALPSLWDQLVKNAVFPVWFDWPGIESEAASLDSYQCLLMDGLLQTRAYCAVLLGNDEAAVEARMQRQEILCREEPIPPRLSVLLTDFVLRNEVGSREIMREQLESLLAQSSPRISIQVVPDPIPSAGLLGAFCLATLPDRSEAAYAEMAARGVTLNQASDIQTIADRLGALRARALPVDQSRDYIRRVLEERWA
jgi:transcriptional regulator with XRE-family HTH domain